MQSVKYDTLIKRGWGIVKRWKLDVDAGDLVADVFLLLGDVDVEVFCKEMNVVAGKLKTNTWRKPEHEVHPDRTCRICNESKQVGWFRSWCNRGYLIIDSYCKPCRNKITSQYKKKKRQLTKLTK